MNVPTGPRSRNSPRSSTVPATPRRFARRVAATSWRPAASSRARASKNVLRRRWLARWRISNPASSPACRSDGPHSRHRRDYPGGGGAVVAVSGPAGAGPAAGRYRHPGRAWRLLFPRGDLPGGQPGPVPDFLAGRQALTQTGFWASNPYSPRDFWGPRMAKKDIKKVVLAYSGGLDTSVILKWLQTEYGAEVVTFTADLGQGEEI